MKTLRPSRFLTSLLAGALVTLSLSPVLAGAVGGPKHSGAQTVQADGTDTYHIRFRGQEEASVVAVAADGEDIDLDIYDEDGDLIASDHDPDSTPVCLFTPDETQEYTIKVRNCMHHDVDYALATN